MRRVLRTTPAFGFFSWLDVLPGAIQGDLGGAATSDIMQPCRQNPLADEASVASKPVGGRDQRRRPIDKATLNFFRYLVLAISSWHQNFSLPTTSISHSPHVPTSTIINGKSLRNYGHWCLAVPVFEYSETKSSYASLPFLSSPLLFPFPLLSNKTQATDSQVAVLLEP